VNSSSNLPRILSALVAVLLASTSGGCYLAQSAAGELSLLSKRRPITSVVADPSTPPPRRAELAQVSSIRDYATRNLGLPDNGSYRSYADIGRAYVVWNVVAAPEFSVDAKEWCYPIVGCVAYRGYFKEDRARAFAAKWRARGFDVSVGGAAAYSTLGHFDDPILNTMVGWNDVELASIIFHELTHQWLYVPGDASFNEALATTVEEEGVRRWLLAQGRDDDLAKNLVQQRRELQVIGLLRSTRAELQVLYASGLAAPGMRERKRATFAAMRAAYAQLSAPWGPHPPFESWFEHDTMNNAHLASVATYYDCVPGFERELASVGGDLKLFYGRVEALARLDRRARDAVVCSQS
jgi:predicted aminopeptidase